MYLILWMIVNNVFGFPYKIQNCENSGQILSIPNAVSTSINMCDNDLRQVYCIVVPNQIFIDLSIYRFIQTFCSGVIVTGGNSLIPGFTDRLNYELSNKFPTVMCKFFVEYRKNVAFYTLNLYKEHETEAALFAVVQRTSIRALDWRLDFGFFGAKY